MTLLNEFEMIEKIGCTRDAFIGYLDAGVFAPCTDKKRGRPTKKAAGSAMYCSELVIKAVEGFNNGTFTPHRPIGQTSASSETTSESRDNGLVGTSGELGTNREGRTAAGKVIVIEGRIPGEKDDKKFDFETTFGKVQTLKEVKAALLKSVSIDVPPNVMKKLQSVYLTMSKDRARREAKKNKISKEKYEADCQKVHETWVQAWAGEVGKTAAQNIVQSICMTTGKDLTREVSNIAEIVHRAICVASDNEVQPLVLKELDNL